MLAGDRLSHLLWPRNHPYQSKTELTSLVKAMSWQCITQEGMPGTVAGIEAARWWLHAEQDESSMSHPTIGSVCMLICRGDSGPLPDMQLT
jgi:hypothetical protein